ncbi:MAG TPA: FGGY family carbohydrate kinase [Actinomycetota bacterium]|nr:FGGY family carbohydrate kinase [Actinomycetota bacterium]
MTAASTDPYVIGCDVGSQGTNVALYSEDGTLCASSYQPYDLAFPNPGWAEQDPELWISATERGISSVLGEVEADTSAVKGLSFGSQLDGMVVCDGAGRALRPALIWMDRRAEAQAAALAERIAPEDFYRRVGANLDSTHAVFRAMWVRDEEPHVFAQAKHVMPPGSYVLWRTTGVLGVDYSNASSLALLDPRSRTWSDEVLEATGIDRAMLPELGAGTQAVGTISAAFAEATGLAPSTVVAMGCGDEMAATLGAGVFAAGEVCDVVGTAEPVCAASPEPHEDPTMLFECHPHADPDAWLLENPGFVSGGNLRWWRDQFAPIERGAEAEGLGDAYDLLSKEAERIDPGSDGVVFVPAMQGAMAPEWNGAARGVFYGLTLAHTRAHMTRAILEGSAFGLRDILEAMKAAGGDVRRLTIVGGGAKGPLWRQIKADVTGLPVRVPESVETTATGAAILAAVAAGVHRDVASAADAFVSFRPDEHEPDPERREIYDDAYRRYREVYFALKPVFASG